MMTQYNDITRFIPILILILWMGCQSESVERYRNGNDLFKTTAPSFIYFKNIKSLKYQSTRNPKTQMDFYRPKTFTKVLNQPIIYPVIIHNWLEDESYLVFEKKNISSEARIMIMPKEGDRIVLNWPEKEYISQLAFLRTLENHLRHGNNIEVKEAGQDTQIIKFSLNQRRSFSAVVQDFLKLTETLSSRAKK